MKVNFLILKADRDVVTVAVINEGFENKTYARGLERYIERKLGPRPWGEMTRWEFVGSAIQRKDWKRVRESFRLTKFPENYDPKTDLVCVRTYFK